MTIKNKNAIFICDPQIENFGDILNKKLIEKITNRKVETVSKTHKADIIPIGSVLNSFFTNKKANQKPFIWSSGFIKPLDIKKTKLEFNVAGLRGKLSLNELERISQTYFDDLTLGDGGLLAPYLLDKKVKKKYEVGIVPHHVDYDDEKIKSIEKTIPNSKIINVLGDPVETLKEIASCKIILSSSLHGLIVADSLGIPNQWIRCSDKIIGGDFKFKDYYSVYNIEPRVWDLRKSVITIKDIANIPKNYKISMEAVEDIQDKLICSLQKIFNVNFKLENKAVPRKKRPAISVIITCYNYGEYLMEAIGSVKRQTFEDYELILIDDCSTNKYTNQLINRLSYKWDLVEMEMDCNAEGINSHIGGNIKIIQNKTNKGVCESRNIATKRAKGKYILYLDADDYLNKNCLQEMYNKIEEGYDIVGSNNNTIGKGDFIKPKFDKYDLCNQNYFSITSLFRKSLFYKKGGFNLNMKEGSEDYEFWIGLLQDGARYYNIKNNLFNYRSREASRNVQAEKFRDQLKERIISNNPKIYNWFVKQTVFKIKRFQKKTNLLKKFLITSLVINVLSIILLLIN